MGIFSSPEIDTSTDAEKLDYVYRRLKAQEKAEIANAVWKWSMRILILVSLAQIYFMVSGLGRAGSGAGLEESLGKSIAEIAKPLIQESQQHR